MNKMTPNNISEQQKNIRQSIRLQRRNLDASQQKQASLQLLKRLINHPKILKAKTISVTLAYDGEINLDAFINWCWQQNKKVFVPVVHPQQTGKLLFLAYQASTKMVKNRFGIDEPELIDNVSDNDNYNENDYLNSCSVQQLDIVFTPMVAFDKHGNRMGMGGGYYDRLLAPWFTSKKGPYPIGLGHDCQYVEQLPTQEWDVPLPEIITPKTT